MTVAELGDRMSEREYETQRIYFEVKAIEDKFIAKHGSLD